MLAPFATGYPKHDSRVQKNHAKTQATWQFRQPMFLLTKKTMGDARRAGGKAP